MTDQILNKAVGKKVKEIAHKTGLSKGYHYQELRGDTPNILERTKVYLDAEDGDTLIQHLCRSQNGFFFKDIERTSDMDFKIVPQIISQFAGFLESLSNGLADGIIEDWEKDEIFSKLDNFNGIVQTLKMQIDRGDYDK